MSAGFTKGPWAWCRGLQYHIIHGKFGGTQIPRGHWIADLGDGVESAANAHLIAAAPDMYEALENAAKVFRRYQALHRNKGTRDGEQKAEANRQLAIEIEAVIALAKGGEA